MKARFADEQIITMITEQETGEQTANVCRRNGISSAAFCKYKSKYSGMEPSDAKRLRAFEDENGKLKTPLAELMLDNAMWRAINPKNGKARWKAAGCGAVDGGSSGQPATGVRCAAR